MEKALEKYLQDPNYEAWWGAPKTWDWDDYQAWQAPTHPAPTRPLGKGKARGRGYSQPESPFKKGSTQVPWKRTQSLSRHQQTKKAPTWGQSTTGSGTTSDARRRRHLGKQWDALEKARAAHTPNCEESMDTHIDKLQKERKDQLRGASPSPGGCPPAPPIP